MDWLARRELPRLRVDFERFETILSAPAWQWLWHGVMRTRAYVEALDGCNLMLSLADTYMGQMDKDTHKRVILKINCLALACLDRLDRLEEFDALYRTLPREECLERYWVDYRAPIVARKLARARGGRPFHHHRPPGELTDKEINDRWDWVCEMARLNIRKRGLRWLLSFIFNY